MNQMISWLINFLITLPVILFSLSFHELMHGYSAYRLGDPTAKNMGRLSLNPLSHIDPIGFLAMVFFHVGWAKPVPINPMYFKKPKRDMAISAVSGPLSNFLLAFIFSFVYVALYRLGLKNASVFDSKAFSVLFTMVGYMVTLNIGLGVFNLIPIPPLDGSKILYAFLPNRIVYKILPYERYIQFGMLILLWLGVLSIPLELAVSGIYRFFITVAQGVLF
jgi:Zn-dependent protease